MKKTLLVLLVFMFLSPRLKGQETYYYGVNGKPLESEEGAILRKEVTKKSDRKYVVRTSQQTGEEWKSTLKEKITEQGDGELVIRQSGNRKMPRTFYRKMEKTGINLYRFSESTLNQDIRKGTSSSFLPLHLEGNVTDYYRYGELKSNSIYRDNQLISNANWLADGSRYIDSVFYSVDREPEYQNGDKYFKNYILQKLSDSGMDLSQVEDVVVISWVVMETGELEGIMATRGRSQQLNQILVNTIAEMPGTWQAAILNGAAVRYYMSFPLNFMQNEANFQELDFSSGTLHYNKY